MEEFKAHEKQEKGTQRLYCTRLFRILCTPLLSATMLYDQHALQTLRFALMDKIFEDVLHFVLIESVSPALSPRIIVCLITQLNAVATSKRFVAI